MTEKQRTAVCEPSTDPLYVRRFHAGAQAERVAAWEQANLCCFCGHDLAAHVEGGCDYEIRDYGETDCLCDRYVERGAAS